MKKEIASLAVTLMLVGCDTATPELNAIMDDLMDDQDSSQMMDDEDIIMMDNEVITDDETSAVESFNADYRLFDSSVLVNGETKVLFFHAQWCPTCRDADNKLTEWYQSQDPSLSVYKVDYDANSDLRAKYGVTYQHTFVTVDGEGNSISSVTGPTDTALMDMIGI